MAKWYAIEKNQSSFGKRLLSLYNFLKLGIKISWIQLFETKKNCISKSNVDFHFDRTMLSFSSHTRLNVDERVTENERARNF